MTDYLMLLCQEMSFLFIKSAEIPYRVMRIHYNAQCANEITEQTKRD